MTNSKALFLIALVLILASIVGYGIWRDKKITTIPEKDQVVCTMEARLCPDGSYVGRSGPKCEFTACPSIPSNPTQNPPITTPQPETITARLGQTVNLFGVQAVLAELVSDSRCAEGVQCVWAGTVEVKVRATYAGFSQDVVLTLNTPYSLGGHTVTLIDATPAKTTRTVDPSQYVFTFKIK